MTKKLTQELDAQTAAKFQRAERVEANKRYKNKDLFLCKSNALQKQLDSHKKLSKKKGVGRLHKTKGEVLPHLAPLNNSDLKDYKDLGRNYNMPPLKGESLTMDGILAIF